MKKYQVLVGITFGVHLDVVGRVLRVPDGIEGHDGELVLGVVLQILDLELVEGGRKNVHVVEVALGIHLPIPAWLERNRTSDELESLRFHFLSSWFYICPEAI